MILALTVVGGQAPQTGDELTVRQAIEHLSATRRETRRYAIERLAAAESVPVEAIPELLSAARTELAAALEPAAPSDKGNANGRIPSTGDDVSLDRVKAGAPDYIDKTFTLCGMIRVWDHYNYGYWDAEKTHYAFQFKPLKKADGHAATENAGLYLLRERGRRLAEQVVRLAERGVEYTTVRVRATIVGNRHTSPEAWRYMELLDWQLWDPARGRWDAWVFAGFDMCFAAIKRAGHEAVDPLVDVIAAESKPPDPMGAAMSAAAIRTLAEVVTEHAAEIDDVADAIEAKGDATNDVESRRRLTSALTSILELARQGKPQSTTLR